MYELARPLSANYIPNGQSQLKRRHSLLIGFTVPTIASDWDEVITRLDFG
jgi:hypothetical protein